jgi:single-strand DNA-binding protein|tara:strand:+ start:2530 stop:2976 length:447 start_codon:yes stop_codon:yes gene_type:complete
MKGVNKVIVLGRVWKEPTTRAANNGNKVTQVDMVTESGTGDYAKADWHKVVFYGRPAEIAEQYVGKGTTLYVEGRINYRKWQAKDGTDRYTTEIIGNILQMINSPDAYKEVEGGSEHKVSSSPQVRKEMSSLADQVGEKIEANDDVPF